MERIREFLENLKNNRRFRDLSEAATKQAIVLPLLGLLGWDTSDPDQVAPEYAVGSRNVDFSLRLNGTNEVFLEVKKPGEDLDNQQHQEQLLDYSFREGVDLAILCNGMTWSFYLPKKKGDWPARRFYTIAVNEQESRDAAEKFVDLLSKTNVETGKALKSAESIYGDKWKKKVVNEKLPEAWNKIVSEPDSLLIDLLSETTEKLCGFRPDVDAVRAFWEVVRERCLLTENRKPSGGGITGPSRPPEPRPRKPSVPRPPGQRITRGDVIDGIVKVLQMHGGKANKKTVEKEMYEMFRTEFEDPYWHEPVSHGIPRWKHEVAWAKEDAKTKRGLIKPRRESRWGIWELTPAGMRWRES